MLHATHAGGPIERTRPLGLCEELRSDEMCAACRISIAPGAWRVGAGGAARPPGWPGAAVRAAGRLDP